MNAPTEPTWYKDAVIYELHVRAFADSNGDGVGDFLGLTERLDYLQDLGVDAIWLLPFYPSPLRDGGYDISDYTGVHPDYGSLDDFKRFLDQAHRRDIKVITELVVNHTSVDHAWFQRARRAPPGSVERDFYVWSDTPHRYESARIIFKDFESSNWAYDPVAREYYWHRFYSHQPDLNFDNPAVHEALYGVLDHWMALGVDGVRLDAVPYLYEREGTSCENLPETHAFLKKLRAHVDAKYANRMLLAEANQWPADAAAYFGDGDECHMNFHFPLMPRLFMALNLEDSFPVVDIMSQTPEIPASCQWATFLRNHDELTLEMVTEEDRDYMYRVYAPEHRARLNLGIRRRLAPLLGDRRRHELLTALLFSLPGTPVLYYGDEIGMGDNIYLGDRDGVRTPMQWNADRNAGFSRANPQRLFLPLVVDPGFHYEAVNVESQQANPSSLLWWTKNLVSLRKQSRLFGRGTLTFVDSANAKVLAFVREHEGERLLVVANLSRFPQHATLLLSQYQGTVPVEMLGKSRFPKVETPHWGISLGPYDYLWFTLTPAEASAADTSRRPLVSTSTWWNIMGEEAPLARRLAEVLPRFRWFRSKGLATTGQRLKDVVHLEFDGEHFALVLVELTHGSQAPETYLVPVAWASGAAARELEKSQGAAIITPLNVQKDDGTVEEGLLYDALGTRRFPERLLKAMLGSEVVAGDTGAVTFAPRQVLKDAVSAELPPPRQPELDQTNSVVFYGSTMVLKLLRQVEEGPSTEEEMIDFISSRAPSRLTPRIMGTLAWKAPKGERAMLGIATEMVPNRGTAWGLFQDAFRAYLEKALTEKEPPPALTPLVPPQPDGGPSASWRAMVDPLASLMELLGRRTGELHLTLVQETRDEDFAPEPFNLLYQQSLYQRAREMSQRMQDGLRNAHRDLTEPAKSLAAMVLASRRELDDRLRDVTTGRLDVVRTRCHGDLHLGQILFTGDDFVFIDFEGEPARSLRERRFKRCPLRDVAGMVRSFDYGVEAGLLQGSVRKEDISRATPWAQAFSQLVSSLYVEAWLDKVQGARLAPPFRADIRRLLRFYLLEKAIYEVRYELGNRPDWVAVPLAGLVRLVSAEWA